MLGTRPTVNGTGRVGGGDGDGYVGGGGRGRVIQQHIEGGGGEEGRLRIGGNRDGNWNIEFNYQISKFKGQLLLFPLSLLRDVTSPPDYWYTLGT